MRFQRGLFYCYLSLLLVCGCNDKVMDSKPVCIQVADTLDEAAWELKTKSGADLAYILQDGEQNITTKIGCYAADKDSYGVFKDFFSDVITRYHGFDPRKVSQICSRNVNNLIIPRDFKSNNEVVSTRVRIARNVDGFNFPSKMSKKERISLEAKIIKAIEESGLKGKYYSLDDIGISKQKQLIAGGILFKNAMENPDLVSAGIANDWPVGRGIFISDDKRLIIWINEEDHVKVIGLCDGYNFYDSLKVSNSGLYLLSKHLSFAMLPDIGYLTSSPANVGTGMKAGIRIKLSNFDAYKAKKFQRKMAKKKMAFYSINNDDYLDDNEVFDIHNMVSFGATEVQIINDMHGKLIKEKLI